MSDTQQALSAQVAERVFGCRVGWHGREGQYPHCDCPGRPHNTSEDRLSDLLIDYAGSWEGAGLVLEWLFEQRMRLTVTTTGAIASAVISDGMERDAGALGDTLPEAICRAALAIVEQREKEQQP